MHLLKFFKYNRFVRGLGQFFITNFGLRRKSFGFLSKETILSPPYSVIKPQNVFIYSNTLLSHFYISAANARFIIKRGTIIGRGLNVQTGNHARLAGLFVSDVKAIDKPNGFDKDVVIEEDVWIGSNVSLLSGVTIGRGCTVAAGAVVTKSTPPYSVVGGIPARVIHFYWSIDTILEHEIALYPPEERLTRSQLEQMREGWE